MNKALAKYLWHILRGTFLGSLAVLTAAVLLWNKPLASAVVLEGRAAFDALPGLMFFCGLLIAAVVFREPVGVGVWLSSRGVTRQSVFVTRLAVGLLAICAATAWCTLLITLGARQFVQLQLGSPYFPMVRWYELRVLPDLFLSAFTPFCFAVAFVTSVQSRLASQGGALFSFAVATAGTAALPILISASLSQTVVLLFSWLVPCLCFGLASVLASRTELSG